MNRLIRQGSTRRRSTRWVSLAACSVVLAACGNANEGTSTNGIVGHNATRFSQRHAVATTTTTAGHLIGATRASTQIVSAWLAAQRAFESAALTSDPNEPSLAATTVSPQLEWTRSLLEQMRTTGQIARGIVQYGKPAVVEFEANRAIVQSCEHDAEITVWATSGQPAPGLPGQVDFELFTSTMELTGSGWKLLTQSVGVGQCNGS
jgi:hypothetical protein